MLLFVFPCDFPGREGYVSIVLSEVTLAFNPMLGKEQKICVCVFI